MTKLDPTAKIIEIGEKALIEEFLRPLFNPTNEKNSVGDDCAAVEIPAGSLALISTDRVPADLISFRTGVLSLHGLGRYLAVLNLSDIAACGGVPLGLLLNCGIPSDFRVHEVLAIAKGFEEAAAQFGTRVVGGDVTSSRELSLSATVLGHVEAAHMLRRSGAKIGDTVFVSREIGLTPLALHYCLEREFFGWLSRDEILQLEGQFASVAPEIELGRSLALSGDCSCCMDNTDGIAQSLSELARESACAILIHENKLQFGSLVRRASMELKKNATTLSLGPGADFGLVGTLRGKWSIKMAREQYGDNIRIIGDVVSGSGLHLRRGEKTEPLSVSGWNYFTQSPDN